MRFLSCCLLYMLLAGCGQKPATVQLAGGAMGTTWHVTYLPAEDSVLTPGLAQEGIEQLLERVEQSMSTYRPGSEIGRFNRATPGHWLEVSADFSAVLAAALAVGEASGGAYDVTIGPLVEMWGFGAAGTGRQAPTQSQIDAVLQRTGQQRLRFDSDAGRVFADGELALDFSSIAKGYGVDLVAEWLSAQRITDFLVEVGGEMRVAGHSPRGDRWRIAIEQPDDSMGGVARALSLSDTAVATSGDYRNYFELDGRRYSHSIDARTGYPVTHDVVSVTVIDPSAMLADAWATALTVLGDDAERVAQEQGLAVYFIRRDGSALRSSHTPAFARYLEHSGEQ